jgi:hypothetical protein
MAKRLFHNTSWTPTATADAATLVNATFMAVQGGTTTALVNLLEVLINGQATTSAPTFLQIAFDSTVMATPTALAAPAGDGPMNPATAALTAATVTATSAGTSPKRSNSTTSGRLELGLNAFGGIMKWNPYTPDMTLGILGNSTVTGEVSLSAYTGGTVGPISAHIIYEPF